ncbi:MAG: hypothetical protein K8T91_20100 [Planctomycetes bacterium]|nr:hypothetical protein [Planctomycetota bacterium]
MKDLIAFDDNQLNERAYQLAEPAAEPGSPEQSAQVYRAISWSPATRATHAADFLQSAVRRAGLPRVTAAALELAAHPDSELPAASTDAGAAVLLSFGSPRQKTIIAASALGG